MYDYLIVGAGLFGSVFAHIMTEHDKKCLVIDKRPHIGGNCYTENVCGIEVHKYGAHIFHTSSKIIWDFMNRFAEFAPFINSPVAINENRAYNMPFNMNTFSQIFGVITPDEARQIIENDRIHFDCPKNLEEQALDLVGVKIYNTLIKGYTEKQWGRSCKELPPSLIANIPLRYEFDNNYFHDRWQGVPIGGYTRIFDQLLDGSKVCLNTEYDCSMADLAKKVVHTGMIDQYYDYQYGRLEYRALRWEHSLLHMSNYQGNAVINYTGSTPDYTRSIEHKFFDKSKITEPFTIVSREFPEEYDGTNDPFYPIPTESNLALHKRYMELSRDENIAFKGWCGGYSDDNMSTIIIKAMALADSLLKPKGLTHI
ncbi:MAG: UDP-galactopyranose mutase [Oscillospiraceae bacterium]|nr:UDP-galactopyranose mutase [Oscillospiraceae bacterium]